MSIKNIVIRKMEISDAAAISRIIAAITKTGGEDDYRHIAEEHTKRKSDAGFVAELEGRVAGFMGGYVLLGGFGLKKSVWIAMFGVDPRYMGQGIGEKLATSIFKYCKKEGVENVYTSVRWDSPDLLSFFKRLGFKQSNFINLIKRI